jgi:hypothetical protein
VKYLNISVNYLIILGLFSIILFLLIISEIKDIKTINTQINTTIYEQSFKASDKNRNSIICRECSLLENDLRDILTDSSDSCEYDAFVDKDGTTKIKIECTVNDEEKQNAWIQLQLKHSIDCSLSVEPGE